MKFQVVDQIKTASFRVFAIQIDESTDIFWSSLIILLHGKYTKKNVCYNSGSLKSLTQNNKKKTFALINLCKSRFFPLLQIKSNTRINLTLKMTFHVHSLRLHAVFNCFQISKNKYCINLKIVNVFLNLLSFLIFSSNSSGMHCGWGNKKFRLNKGRHATKRMRTTNSKAPT